MPPTTPPRLEGQIEIVASVNDKLQWDEGGTPLSVTLTAGVYWPFQLVATLQTAMDAESLANGAGRSYTVSLSIEDGKLTISVNVGVWFPKITAVETAKLLTGGDTAIFGTRGENHLGWEVDGAYPSGAASFTGDVPVANSWHPNEPTDKDTGDRPRFAVGQSIDLSSQAFTRVFTSKTSPPKFRTLSFQLIKSAQRTEWFETLQLYGVQGKQFALYKPRDAGTRDGLYVLTGASLEDPSFEEQQHHMPWWRGELRLLRVGD